MGLGFERKRKGFRRERESFEKIKEGFLKPKIVIFSNASQLLQLGLIEVCLSVDRTLSFVSQTLGKS